MNFLLSQPHQLSFSDQMKTEFIEGSAIALELFETAIALVITQNLLAKTLQMLRSAVRSVKRFGKPQKQVPRQAHSTAFPFADRRHHHPPRPIEKPLWLESEGSLMDYSISKWFGSNF